MKLFRIFAATNKLIRMLEKFENLTLDVVKYLVTVLALYPLLTAMDKDWVYYIGVGSCAVALSAWACLLHYLNQKNENRKKKNIKKNKPKK
jgi:hypothetical protein